MAPLLNFFDGFDSATHQKVSYRYPDSQLGFDQGSDIDGYCPQQVDTLYFDKCYAILNTAFGRVMLRRSIVPGATTAVTSVWVGAHLKFTQSGAWSAFSDFLQLDDDDGVGIRFRQVALAITNTRALAVYVGGSVPPSNANGTGTLVYTSAPNFFDAAMGWEWYDFYLDSTGLFEVWRDGVQVIDEALTMTGGGSGYSHISVCWELFGPVNQNRDNYAWATNERIGPLRVTSIGVHATLGDMFPGTYAGVGTYPGPVTPEPPIGGRLRDFFYSFGNAPDTDTYVSGSGQASFRMERARPVGEPIYALAVLVTAYGDGGATSMRGVVERSGLSYYSDAQTVSAGPNYKTYTFQWALDPSTGLAWREADFLDATFTFGWDAVGAVRVTQLIVTRAHQLREGIGSLYRAR